MVRVEAVLREFAGLADHAGARGHRGQRSAPRSHRALQASSRRSGPRVRGGRLSNIGLAEQLGTLRVCLDRLSEWDGEDAPARVLMFAGDIPRRDQPLPRFIDDAAAAKLLRAAREHPDPFTRLAVEFLARTGLRKGEFLDLTVDSVVQIGAAYWLHVPLGKLRTDRYIPLHPQLKEMLDEWVANRPAGLREPWLFIERGRRIGKQRVEDAVANAAQRRRDRARDPAPAPAHARDPGDQPRHVTRSDRRAPRAQVDADDDGLRQDRQPHRRRRVLQASPRRSKRSTTPPRNSRRPPRAPRCASSAQRCTGGCSATATAPARVGLDCHFESICESCTYFQTTLEFRPTLQRQRDDAADKGQVGRQKIFDGLLTRLDAQSLMTAPMPDPRLFEVAANPDPGSSLPFLIRLPLPDGELVLKARDSWPRTAKVYCHRADHWPEDPEIVERIPVRSCQRRGVAIDLVLDRPRENRSQLVFTRIQGGREGIFWQSARTTRQARPGIRVPRRRAADLAQHHDPRRHPRALPLQVRPPTSRAPIAKRSPPATTASPTTSRSSQSLSARAFTTSSAG